MEGLKNYRVSNRRYRNRRIGDFLKELHLTEGRNTGFKKILDALEANGSPKPEFETDESHSYFISRLFIHEVFLEEKDEDGIESTPSTPNQPQSTPNQPQFTLVVPDSVSEAIVREDAQELILRNQILLLIKVNPVISKREIIEILGISMYSLKKELARMREEHVAEFVGYSRNGKWVVYDK